MYSAGQISLFSNSYVEVCAGLLLCSHTRRSLAVVINSRACDMKRQAKKPHIVATCLNHELTLEHAETCWNCYPKYRQEEGHALRVSLKPWLRHKGQLFGNDILALHTQKPKYSVSRMAAYQNTERYLPLLHVRKRTIERKSPGKIDT